MFEVRPYVNCKFIEELPKSNKSWRLSCFIPTGSYYVVCPKLGPMPTQFFRGDEPFLCLIYPLMAWFSWISCANISVLPLTVHWKCTMSSSDQKDFIERLSSLFSEECCCERLIIAEKVTYWGMLHSSSIHRTIDTPPPIGMYFKTQTLLVEFFFSSFWFPDFPYRHVFTSFLFIKEPIFQFFLVHVSLSG